MEEVKDIVFLTLTLGWENEKQPSGPTELDLEAGNLVKDFPMISDFQKESFIKNTEVCCEMSQIRDTDRK